MAKGMSPLRLFMRSAPRKTVPDSIDGSSSGLDGPSAAAQARQPLCPIPETARNPLTPALEQSIGDPATPRGKSEQPTPRPKGKNSFHGQEKFPHLENLEGNVNSITDVTPDKIAITSFPSSVAASLAAKNKFTWQHRQSSTAQTYSRDGAPDLSTPPRPSKQSASFDVSQAAASCGNSGSGTQQILSSNSRGVSNGGGSVPGTPKSVRAVGARSTNESETGGSQSQNATPSKSVSRSLKYGQQANSSNSGTSGFTTVRPTGSQHANTRPIGYLQAVKGVVHQTVNQNFAEQHFELEEDPSFWRDHNVQVLIRTRPISNSELGAQGLNRCLKQESPHTLSWLGQPESRFTFDHVAGETVTQAKLFEVAGLPMVENCMSGYNSCMFAYGQTGSGKTHTMLGDIEDLDRSPRENRGMTPRVFEYLFGRIQMELEGRRQEHLKFFCKCSFLEIYNEQITDLLEPSSTNLQMREDAKKGVYVENLSEVEVQCVQDVIQLLLQGASNRKVAATNMNRESSRSHSVFTCVVESKWEANSMTNSRYGRLHLVDLAGSERQKSSGAEGGRLKEAANINKSLSTLGLVIMILVDVANGKQRHVPYRDSKLTFLLQDSLGGNSKTIMIANVSPSSCCAMETLSTLKFAQRAKFIRNNAVINEDASGDVIALRQQIEELKVEVDRLRRDSISRAPSLRLSALQNGPAGGEESGDKLDVSTMECTEIGSSSPDSVDTRQSKTLSSKSRSVELVLAGALRREQAAEDITKKLAAEIEQLNRLVRQREEDSQCSKMMLRFREEKIRRLEGIADNVLSVDVFYEKERKSLMDELQLIRARIDRNPELTRFAMENIRLLEQLRRYQEFYDCGERDVLLEEISGLRNQLLDALDIKLGEEQTRSDLSTPQKRALAPEFAALARENELLLVEVESYQKELKECRNNLNSCLVANADLARQVDDLQATLNRLKNERPQSQDSKENKTVQVQLQEQLKNALDESENLGGKIQASEESKELLVSADEAANHVHSTGASLAAQETASSATVKQIRTETEELALQSLADIEKAALIWRKQESELRKQLKEADDLNQKLLAEVKSPSEDEVNEKCSSEPSMLNEEDVVGKQVVQGRWEKLQEIEMRHAEEIMQLQLELESMDDVLKEERQQRLGAEQKSGDLSSQLSSALSKLEQAQGLVEALEGQQLFSINELENLQAEHTKILTRLKQQEDEEKVLQEQLLDDPAVFILEQKLQRAKKGKEEARKMNKKFQEEKASRMALEKEREVTMSVVETQAALAITTLQSEILDLREEISAAAESEANAKLQILHLTKEVDALEQTVGEHKEHNRHLSDKCDEYKSLVKDKEVQLRGLEAEWKSATDQLMHPVADCNCDQALAEVAKEAEGIIDESHARKQGSWTDQEVSQMEDDNRLGRRKAAESVHHTLQDVPSLARETEGKVRALSEATVTLDVKQAPPNPERHSYESQNGEAIVRESEKKSMAAFLIVGQLVERIKVLEEGKQSLAMQNQEAYIVLKEKEIALDALQQDLDHYRYEYTETCGRHQVLIVEHDNLQHVHARTLEDNALSAEDRERMITLSERKAMATFVMLEQLVGKKNELKAVNVGLEKEIQEAHIVKVQQDTALAALQKQLEQDGGKYREIADRHQLLIDTHGVLQEEHERLVRNNTLIAEDGERMIRVSERKAMAAFVTLEQLLGNKKELKVANGRLEKEIQEAHVVQVQQDTALAALQQQLEQDGHKYREIADRQQLLMDAHRTLQEEHERLIGESAFIAEDGERMIRLCERRAMAAFVMLEQLAENKNVLKADNVRLKMDIQAGRMIEAQKDTALGALQQQLEQDADEYSEIAHRYQLLMDAHGTLQEEHKRLGADNALIAEDGERMIKMSERKAMAAFVILEQLENNKKVLEAENISQEMKIQEGHIVLVQKDRALVAMQQQMAQDGHKYAEIAHRHQLLMDAHQSLQEEHGRFEEKHERLVAENALAIEDGEHRIRLSERRAMAAFAMLEQLVDNKKVLKVDNVRLKMEIQEGRIVQAQKDTALMALQQQLEEDGYAYRDIAERHELLMDAHGKLQEEHERLVGNNALIAEDGDRMIRLSERKAMAAFMLLEQLVDNKKVLEVENVRQETKIQEGHIIQAQKDTALVAMQHQIEQDCLKYAEITDGHQLLMDANDRLQEEHKRLKEKHGRLLSDNALIVEDGERTIRLSERRAMAAFVILEQLVDNKKVLMAENARLEMENREEQIVQAQKVTALVALQQQMEQDSHKHKEIADRHHLLMDAHGRLQEEFQRSQEEHEKLMGDNSLVLEDWKGMIRLSEKRAMAAFVTMEQLLDSKKYLKAANMRLEKEIQEAHIVKTQKDAVLSALQQQLEQEGHKYMEIGDRHRLLMDVHGTLQEEHEKLREHNALIVVEGERMVRLSERKAMAAFVMLEQVMNNSNELKETNAGLEKEAEEILIADGQKARELVALQQQVEQSGYQCTEIADRYQLLMDAHERLQEELDRLREVHDRLLRENATIAEDQEVMLKLSEKKAMASLTVVDHLMDRIMELKVTETKLVKATEEGHLALLEKDTGLAAQERQLEENNVQYRELRDGHRSLVEKFGNLKEEHGTCLAMNGDLKQQVQDLQLIHRGNIVRVNILQDILYTAEQEITEVEAKAVNMIMKEVSVHDVALTEGAKFISGVMEKLETLLREVSQVEATVDRLDSVEKELSVGLLKVTRWEEENAAERAKMESLQSKFSLMTTTVSLQERDMEFAREERDNCLATLEKEIASNKNWVQERDSLTIEKEQAQSDSLGKEKVVEGLLLEVQRLESSLKQTDLRVSEMQMGVQALTVAKEELELERNRLVISAHEAETKCSQKEQVLAAIQGDLADLQARVREAELSDQSISKKMEELTAAKLYWELEKAAVEREIQEMREEKDNLRSDANYLHSEVGKRETAIFDNFRRSQQALEKAHFRMIAMDQDLAGLVISKENVEHDIALLESAASSYMLAFEEKEHEYLEMRRRLESAELQITEMQSALTVATAQILVEKDNREADKRKMEEMDASETELRSEIGGLEILKRNLEHDMACLELAASGHMVALSEKENEYLEMQRRLGTAELRISELHTAIDSAATQYFLEKSNWDADKRKLEEEKDARETELRDDIAAAELKLLATQRSLKIAVENEQALGVRKVELDEEILKLNEDAAISLSKATVQEEKIDSLKEQVMALKSECTAAEENILALNELREEYILSEMSWRSERELLTRRVEELEVSSRGRDTTVSKGPSEVGRAQCLPPGIPPSEGEKSLEDVRHQLHREKLNNEALRAKVCEKDMTILSARKEMEIAIANLKEAELEMDKVHREKERLTETDQEKKKWINSISFKLKTAEEELLKRDIRIEGCEVELRTVAIVLSDWDIKMHDVEKEWRKEKEALAQELMEAKLDATEKRNEAAVLLQKFQDGQATLREAEGIVDALVRANENAKHHAQDWKTEKESLGVLQGWWMPERDKLVAAIARLETDMHTQKQDMWMICKEAVIDLIEMMDVLSLANEEISILKIDHQQEIEHLLNEIKILKDDLVAGLKFPGDLRLDLETFFTLCRNQMDVACGLVFVPEKNHQLAEANQDFEMVTADSQTSEIHGVKEEAVSLMQSEGEVEKADLADQANEGISKSVPVLCNEANLEDELELQRAEQEGGIAKVELERTDNMLEFSEEKNVEEGGSVNFMVFELEEARIAGAARNISDLTLQLTEVQGTVDHLERELEDKARIVRDLDEKLRSAYKDNATLVEKCNLQVLQREDEQNQSTDQLTRALSAEVLVFNQLQMEFKGLTRDIEYVKSQTTVAFVDELQAGHDDMRKSASEMAALKDEVHELEKLSYAVQVDVTQTEGAVRKLLHGLILDQQQVADRVANNFVSVKQLEDDRTSLYNQLGELLKKFERVPVVTAFHNEASKKPMGDQGVAAGVEQQLQALDVDIEKILLENIGMRCQVQTLQPRVAALELEIDQYKLEFHKMVIQIEQSEQFLQLHQQEFACTHENLMSTLAFCATLVSEIPGISLQCEELYLFLQSVDKLKHKFHSDMEEVKEEIIKSQQEALEERQVSEQENKTLMAEVQDLQLRNSILEDELDEKRNSIDILAEELMLEEQRMANSFQLINSQLKAIENDRDKFQTEVVVLNEQLEMTQALADERELVAAEARQVAEVSKTHAKQKEVEARILGRSVEELESTVYALESQLGIVKREAERQRVAREVIEKEVEAVKKQMATMQSTIDSKEAQTVMDVQDAETAKSELDRIVIEMKNQQIQARKSVESLQQECAEKDVQLRTCKSHIAELMFGAEKQASENQQKLKTLESMVEQLKVEDRKANPASASAGKAAEKLTTSKVKGAGSPFKCIGSGLAQQRTSEIDEELSAAKRRIKEVEVVAASRQKEIFMLNTKLAEAESMTHDVVRDLLGVKMDIASYATLLNQQQVQRIAERARRRTVEAQEKEEQLDTLKERLNEFIEERESWLEEINRRQAEAVAARVSAEKLRLRDQTLTAENERFQEECSLLRKKVVDIEEEIKKLSGQQNLQQRIHHHAKIKEENNSFRLQNEDLSGKLRRMEILFTRVNDELARYRTNDGKSAFLDFDEEARLQKELKETEENRLQLAQSLIGLCTVIMQAAGIQRTSKDIDPAAEAMTAVQQLQDRQECLERELSDYKLKAKIAGEKRRLSDLRDFQTPVKTICTNFTATQQLPSPISSSR